MPCRPREIGRSLPFVAMDGVPVDDDDQHVALPFGFGRLGDARGAAKLRDGCDAHAEALPLRVDRKARVPNRTENRMWRRSFQAARAITFWPGSSYLRSARELFFPAPFKNRPRSVLLTF